MITELKEILIKAVKEAGYDVPVGFDVSISPKKEMGDYASNIALLIAKHTDNDPRKCAEKLKSKINKDIIQKIDIAGPGFVNILLKKSYYCEIVNVVLNKKEQYGSTLEGDGKMVNVEYISANPTGPVHIGNARGGPIGECIANLLKFNGYKVHKSFYVNDIGGQIDKLAESFYYYYEISNGLEATFPEGGYPGLYIKETVKVLKKKYKKELDRIHDKDDYIVFFKDKGVKAMVELIKNEVQLLGIEYDEFIYQSELENSGKTKEIIDALNTRGATVNREGALWFKNADNLDNCDNEDVLQKSDGSNTYTYFADDIACHKYKIDQGAIKMIDIWGSNHHGHIARMKSAMTAIGVDPNKLEILLYQNVRVKNGEEIIKMSKREGNFIMLADVIKYGVGSDVFKYYILSQNCNTPIDFDLELAKDKSEKNPVYYIQYAYARICSILRKAGKFNATAININILEEESELELIKIIAQFPDIINETSKTYAVQLIAQYSYSLATSFHNFYSKCRVLDEEEKLKNARLALITATKIVLNTSLSICGISTPERM